MDLDIAPPTLINKGKHGQKDSCGPSYHLALPPYHDLSLLYPILPNIIPYFLQLLVFMFFFDGRGGFF